MISKCKIDRITVPNYFSDIFVLQEEINPIKVRKNEIDRMSLQERVAALESIVANNTQAISYI
jgi:hypothetical protein